MSQEHKWDIRFLNLAKTISRFSKDPSTRVGAIIVRPDKSIVSTGYNGFPRGMEDRAEWYENRDEKYSRIIHAEINALIQARQDVSGYTLYTWPFMCCDRCAVQMIQAGIIKFVYPATTRGQEKRWGAAFRKAQGFFGDCGVQFYSIHRKKIS